MHGECQFSARKAPRGVRILVFKAAGGIGGAEVLMEGLYAGLQCRGHEVKAVVLEAGPLCGRLQARGIEAESWAVAWTSPRSVLNETMRAACLISAWRPDLIHVHGARANALSFLGRAVNRTPVLVFEHGIDPWRDRPAWNYFDRLISRPAHVRLVVARAVGAVLAAKKITPRGRLVVVPTALPPLPVQCDWGAARVELAQSFDSPPKVLVGAVGRLEREKGFGLLIHAVSGLRSRGHDVSLIILGEGSLREELAETAEALGMGSRLAMPGFSPDAAALMAGLDIVAISSLTEGLPLVLLEAMRAGRCIVSTRVGGIPELLTDDVNALLVERGSIKQLEAAIEEAVVDQNLRKRLGRAAKMASSLGTGYEVYLDEIEKCGRRALATRMTRIPT